MDNNKMPKSRGKVACQMTSDGLIFIMCMLHVPWVNGNHPAGSHHVVSKGRFTRDGSNNTELIFSHHQRSVYSHSTPMNWTPLDKVLIELSTRACRTYLTLPSLVINVGLYLRTSRG